MGQHMWVANCTTQVWEFAYTLPGGKRSRRQIIEVGRQIRLAGELSPLDIQAIVRQWERYGLRPITEVKSLRDYTGLIFSLDGPINPEKYVKPVLIVNHDVLEERGRQQRIEAGIASAAQLSESAKAAGMPMGDLEVSIIEDEHTDGTEPTFAETVKITRKTSKTKPTVETRTVQAGKRKQAA
jgi:hypothetical protein